MRDPADRCPTLDELADLIGDRLDPPHRDLLELHLGACPECQGRVLSATGNVSRAFHAPGPPGPADESIGSDPRETFLGRLREAVRGQVGSTPAPKPWDAIAEESASGQPLPRIRGLEIHHQLGRGGMATVYRARQIGLNRLVALKLIWMGLGPTVRDAMRLSKGPRTIARLSHPHIIQVHQIGKQDGWVYAVLEYLDGGDLKGAIRGGPWEPRRAATLMRTLAGAVHFMHGRGVVHRDLKSSNILLTARGVPKIADFGLASVLDDEESSISEPGSPLGTPSYMPPEQAAGFGSSIGPAADIHSLGAILYELLVGLPPFLAPTRAETLRQVLEKVPDPPSSLRPGVPPALDEICRRCLEKDPLRRYPDAREMADELSRFLDGPGSTGGWIDRIRSRLPGNHAACELRHREAEQARARAEAELDEAEQTLYLARIALAGRELDRGDPAAARAVLIECSPRPGRPDRRDQRWNELWARCESEPGRASFADEATTGHGDSAT